MKEEGSTLAFSYLQYFIHFLAFKKNPKAQPAYDKIKKKPKKLLQVLYKGYF